MQIIHSEPAVSLGLPTSVREDLNALTAAYLTQNQ